MVLRGSHLSSEDKKRVLVESGAESGGTLTMGKVTSAIRLLGSAFFQEYTTGKKDKTLKTYDQLEEEEDLYWTNADEQWEGDNFELAAEDPDAALVLQFESAVNETIQEDSQLSAYYSSYQEARKRLQEKTKNRGFWNSKGGSTKGYGKKGVKGKTSKGKGFKTLQQRIAESHCRVCNQRGHWKAECPMRKSATPSDDRPQIPTSAAVAIDLEEIPEATHEDLKEDSHHVCFGTVHERAKSFGGTLKNKLAKRDIAALRSRKAFLTSTPGEIRAEGSERETLSPGISNAAEESQVFFASTGTTGVVDLGASQTVIGHELLKELLEQLPEEVRKQVRKTTCNLLFRFGNHQTLESRTAVLIPMQRARFRIAVVHGKTPFLISSQLLKQLGAVIDTSEGTSWS